MYFSILNLPWRTFIDETKEKREEPYDPLFLPLTKLGAKTRDRRFLCVVGEVLTLGWLKYKTFEVSLQVWQPLSSFWLFLLCWLKWYKVKRSNVTLFYPGCKCNRGLVAALIRLQMHRQQRLAVFARDSCHSMNDHAYYIRCRVHLAFLLPCYVAGYIIPNPCFKYLIFSSDGYKCWRLWWQHCPA